MRMQQRKDEKRLNKNEKAAMLAELKVCMKDAHREARTSSDRLPGTLSIKAVQAQRVVNAVKQVLAAGLSYSMERKDIPDLFEDLNRRALDEVNKEMEETNVQRSR